MKTHSIICGAALCLAPVAALHAQQVAVPQAEAGQLLGAYALIKSQYVENVDDKKLFNDAIGGMLAALDPHSRLLGKDDLDDMAKETAGEYVGVGMVGEVDQGQLKVVSTSEGSSSSAERAGIEPGDLIVSIDGVAVSGDSHRATKCMRGAPGSFVTIEVKHPGERTARTLRLERTALHSETVKAKTLATGLAWIRVSEFEGATAADLAATLKRLDGQGAPPGVVLDLRNNPGGLVPAAVGVAAMFLPADASVFSARGRMAGANATITAAQRYYRSPNEPDVLEGLPAWVRKVPLAVLVNGASASSAELVAGALQDNGRARIVGSQTFGKGSIQSVIPLSADSAVKMTVARYFTPSGHEIQARGITPDVKVQAVASSPDLLLREADLAHHLAAAGGEPGPDANRAPVESTRSFGTASDKTLQAAVALLTPQKPSRPARLLRQLASVFRHDDNAGAGAP